MPKNLSASGGLRPPDQGLCLWTPLGALPPDPLIGSCSTLAVCPPTFKLLLPPLLSGPPVQNIEGPHHKQYTTRHPTIHQIAKFENDNSTL